MTRCAEPAANRGLAGPVIPAAACFCMDLPEQTTDNESFATVEAFVTGQASL